MHQPVVLDADVHKRAEIDHVAHGAGQHHALAQVVETQHVVAQHRRRQIVARVAARPQQRLEDVVQGGNTDIQQLSQRLEVAARAKLAQPRAQINHPPVEVGQRQQVLGHGIALGVNRRPVQRVPALRHAQEAGRLLVCLRSQPLDLQQIAALLEGAVLVAPGDDVLRQLGTDAGHVLEQSWRGGVSIHAHRVDCVFHHRVQRACQLLLVHVVLVQPDADALRVDLDQLGQRVLQAAGDADRAAHRHVQVGKLVARQPRRRVDAGPRFTHHHIRQPLSPLSLFSLSSLPVRNHLRRQLLCLAAGRAVADRQDLDAKPLHGSQQQVLAALTLSLRLVWVDGEAGQVLAGAIHHSDLAAGAETGVDAHHHLAADGRLHQQGFEVGGEDVDRVVIGDLGQTAAGLALDGRRDQPAVAVLHRRPYVGRKGRPRVGEHPVLDLADDQVVRRVQRHLQHTLCLAAVDGQQLVRRQVGHRRAEFVVHLVLVARIGALLCQPHENHAVALGLAAGDLARDCVLADVLGDDVARAGQRVVHRRDLGVEEPAGQPVDVHRGALLQHPLSQRLQPALPGNGRPRASPGTVGQIEILDLLQGVGGFDG